jgi:hypothetical protein
MEVIGETNIGDQLVILGICAYLVSVHAHHGHLDGPSEVEVTVAQMIRGRLKLILVHA